MKVGVVVPYSWSFGGGVVDHAEAQRRALEAIGHREAFGLNWYEYSIGVEQENYANLRTASIVGDKITLTLGEAGTDANLVCARVVAMNLKKYGADYYQRLCKMRNDAAEEKEKK